MVLAAEAVEVEAETASPNSESSDLESFEAEIGQLAGEAIHF